MQKFRGMRWLKEKMNECEIIIYQIIKLCSDFSVISCRKIWNGGEIVVAL